MDPIEEVIEAAMHYVADADGYLLAVSFGADISCHGQDCVDYVGNPPEGFATWEAWYASECEQLHKWQVVDGVLVKDDDAADPVDLCRADYVIEQGKTNGWTWRKWYSGVSECWGVYEVSGVACTTAAGSMYVTGTINPSMPFPDGLFRSYSSSTEDDPSMTCQMTFTSYQGTPALIWSNGFVHPDEGASRFMLMRHSAATINGQMKYSYKGRWRGLIYAPTDASGILTADGFIYACREE